MDEDDLKEKYKEQYDRVYEIAEKDPHKAYKFLRAQMLSGEAWAYWFYYQEIVPSDIFELDDNEDVCDCCGYDICIAY